MIQISIRIYRYNIYRQIDRQIQSGVGGVRALSTCNDDGGALDAAVIVATEPLWAAGFGVVLCEEVRALYRWVDRQMGRQTDRQIDTQIDTQMDRLIDRQTDRQMEQINRLMDRYTMQISIYLEKQRERVGWGGQVGWGEREGTFWASEPRTPHHRCH